jgi:hypothetical protein
MEVKEVQKQIGPFLKLNGFEYNKPDKSFINDYCSIEIQKKGYAVCNNNGDVWYSHDFTIYTLIGYLTYYGYMNKNYVK